jgi:hypothetical protein
MVRMREAAREEARARFLSQSPSTQRRLRRCMNVAVQRATLGVTDATALIPDTNWETTTNIQFGSVRFPLAHLQPLQMQPNHLVPVIGEEPPRLSQDALVLPQQLERRPATRGRARQVNPRGRGRTTRRGHRLRLIAVTDQVPGAVTDEIEAGASRGQPAKMRLEADVAEDDAQREVCVSELNSSYPPGGS